MIEVSGPERGVATVTIANAGRRNALDLTMFRALAAAWRRLDADDAVRVIVVTGADGCFSSGADLGSISADMSAAIAGDGKADEGSSPGRRAWSDVNEAVLRGVRMSTPVIA